MEVSLTRPDDTVVAKPSLELGVILTLLFPHPKGERVTRSSRAKVR